MLHPCVLFVFQRYVPLVISQRMVFILVSYVNLVNINLVLDPGHVTAVQVIADAHDIREHLLSTNADVCIKFTNLKKWIEYMYLLCKRRRQHSEQSRTQGLCYDIAKALGTRLHLALCHKESTILKNQLLFLFQCEERIRISSFVSPLVMRYFYCLPMFI
jgi:hypothetical protein